MGHGDASGFKIFKFRDNECGNFRTGKPWLAVAGIEVFLHRQEIPTLECHKLERLRGDGLDCRLNLAEAGDDLGWQAAVATNSDEVAPGLDFPVRSFPRVNRVVWVNTDMRAGTEEACSEQRELGVGRTSVRLFVGTWREGPRGGEAD